MSDRALPLFVEYALEEQPSDLGVSWDLNHLKDADWDGEFRNDHDAIGLTASYIYNTNRTPFVVTVTAIAADGITYVGSDEFSFVIQAGDEVVLSANDPRENAGAGSGPITWTSLPGDPLDSNWRINSAEGTAWLAPRYPGTCTICASTAIETITTELYVFNPDPDLLSIRGMNQTRTGFGHVALEYVGAVYKELASRGFNWINIPFTWMYSRTGRDYDIYAPEARGDQQHPTDEKLVAATEIGHEAGLNVSWSLGLQESEDTPNPILRWTIEGSDGFFEGDDGYTAFALHAADLAWDASPEMLMAFVEMGALQMPSGKPYLESFYSELREALPFGTALSTSNLIVSGCDLPECRPEPYLDRYATPYAMLDSVGFSSYMPIGGSCDSGIELMQRTFDNQQLEIFRKVQEGPGKGTALFISEYGCPAFDCAASCFGLNGPPCQSLVVRDDEEQRRATAAVLRAMYDLVREGNDWFSGILWWEWILNTDEGMAESNWADLRLNWRSALEEITAFYLDSPHKIETTPVLTPYKWHLIYFDSEQEVGTRDPASSMTRSLQSFEANVSGSIESRAYAGAARLDVTTGGVDNETRALQLDYSNYCGRGGEAIVEFPVSSSVWRFAEGVSIRVKKSNPDIGLGFLLFEDTGRPYTLRIPTIPSTDWQEVEMLMEFATRSLSVQETRLSASGRYHLAPQTLGLYLYSLTGGPVSGTVWIDEVSACSAK